MTTSIARAAHALARKVASVACVPAILAAIVAFPCLVAAPRSASAEDYFLLGLPAQAQADAAARSLSPNESRRPAPLAVLGPEDAALYREIFALQDKGQFTAAERLAPRVKNQILMGHVLKRVYLQPTGTRATSRDLANWLSAYADVPGADDVYALALKRQSVSDFALTRPEARGYRQRVSSDRIPLTARKLSDAARDVADTISKLVRSERPGEALKVLNAWRATFDRNEYDDTAQLIATSFFVEGQNDKALTLASEIAERNRREVPLSDWTAGLAAWRLHRFELAEQHFAALGRSETAIPATRAAGAYWAARASLRLRHPERVGPMLEIAATAPRTFYGVLALRQLGRPLPFDWTLPPLDQATWSSLSAYPAVPRAVALMQIGRPDLAEEELLRVHGKMPPELDPALLAVATSLSLSAVQMKIANSAEFQGFDGGLYPVPDIVPQGGFTIDPALLYAFMHQESRFDATATSASGARGLMQLMPATASRVTGDEALASGKSDKLLDPAFNLRVAQDYLHELMRLVEPHGNLYMLAVAYNGGPGNLARWREKLGADTDPLLFIETVPSAETRGFIECVLTNYWAYRSRLGEDTASLDAAAAGDWPVYDSTSDRVAMRAQ